MRSKKIILFLIVLLVLVFTFAFKNSINADSLQTSDAFYVNGAQVRTSGNAGIRFVGYIGSYNDTNVTKYGILMAFGETEASDNFYKGATINGKVVAYAECDSVNENGYFYITLYDIPEIYYNQKISARAYVIEGDNIIYSSNVTIRSLGDVVKSAYNNGDTSEFVSTVYEALQNSFYEISYELNGGTLTNKPDYIHSSSSLELPIPTKDGYTFLGWKLYSSLQELVWEISKPSDNITLYAVWGNEGIYVGENLAYTTLQSAISAASSNSTIIVMPGTYEGATINKTLTIKGYNALTNLDLTDETLQSVFTSDLIIAANNVTISGVVITGTAKFMNKTGMNISNPTIKYSIVRNSTVNPTTSDSNIAPFNFTNTSAYSINNLTITDCKIEQITTGRPMIAYLSQVNGLTIKNSEFYGRKTLANYNDGIKTNKASGIYGVKGNVTITGNYFANYQQYVIWLRSYGAGTYTIENNQFVNCGCTAGSHASITFGSYVGTSSETVNISHKYNTLTSCYILFRMDTASSLTNSNTSININYNKMASCKDTIYIKNSSTVTPNIENNYWGTTTLSADNFTGASVPSAYYSSATDVPSKGTVENLSYNITYNLNGGKWLSDEYTYDECVNDLVADLSAYYGKEITSTNVADITYEASVTMSDFFFTHETYSTKWTWLAEFMMETRQNDANQSSGYTNLVNKDDRTWRFEVQAFTSKTVPAWPYGSDYSIESVQNNYKEAAEFKAVHYSGPTSYVDGKGVTLVEPIYNTCIFLYWVDQNDKIYYDNIPTNVSGDLTLTAVYDNIVNVSSIVFENLVDTIEIIDTYQLNWEIKPLDATNKTLTFSSSNNSIFTVDANGLITPIALGTATLSVVVEGNKELNFTQEITIIPIAQFVFSYETTSYTTVGEIIKINNYYLQDSSQITDLNWESQNPNIATVDNGLVTGVSTGTATIRSSLKNNPNVYVDFTITVLPDSLSDIAKIIVDAHNSNIFTRYSLLVGTKNEGDYGYLKDMIGSVSDLLYNNPLEIDTKYLATGNANKVYNENELLTKGLEFVTVHYTGNFGSTADSDNNASYFASASNVSIHYVTGNHGKYSNGTISSQVYQVIDLAHGAYHAGDSSARDYVGEFKWQATGVQYDGCNLLDVEFTASNDFYFEINGKKTSIPLPGTYDYSSRNTDHIYNSNGTISSQSDYSSPFTNRSPESFFNDQGFPIKVVNGEYYMGTTWWSYRQVREGRICGSGGNRNSIGIEACVNKGSDVWQTYQKTAQLVAKLLYDNNLDVSRVKGHHFFDGKNCPQPLLENDMEIWNEFIDQVIYEYQLITLNNNSRYKITMEAISNGDYINSYGRLSNQPLKSSVITYKVIITDTENNTTEEIVLSSIIEGTNLNK